MISKRQQSRVKAVVIAKIESGNPRNATGLGFASQIFGGTKKMAPLLGPHFKRLRIGG
jgi:hypothetical protein